MNVYVICAYEITHFHSENYFLSAVKAAKIPHEALAQILVELNQQKKREISEEKLTDIARKYLVDVKELKQILISKLHILKPLLSRKIPLIYLNTDDELVGKCLGDTLQAEYNVHYCERDCSDFQSPSLVVFYRKNYSSDDFKRVLETLRDGVYLITCGVLHQQLIIDNLYFNSSGLPTHFSNLHDLMNGSDKENPLSHQNSLTFYRQLYQSNIESFPTLSLTPCQRGYISYSIHQFLTQFIKFDGPPTPHDAINWRWQIDLLKFGIQKNIAIFEEKIWHETR